MTAPLDQVGHLSAVALPDELEVVAWQDEGDLTFPLVRLQDAAHALSQAHSVIEALKAANKALMAERTSLIETKRQQIAWLEEQARDDQREHVKLHKAAQAEVKRLTEENEALRGLLFRYRNETTLGHQPHMIAAEVDQALSGSKE